MTYLAIYSLIVCPVLVVGVSFVLFALACRQGAEIGACGLDEQNRKDKIKYDL